MAACDGAFVLKLLVHSSMCIGLAENSGLKEILLPLSSFFCQAFLLPFRFSAPILLPASLPSVASQKFIEIQDRACGHNPRGEGGFTDAFRFSRTGRLKQRVRLLRRGLERLFRFFLQRDEGRSLALAQRTNQRQP